jgi:hypothetical protein
VLKEKIVTTSELAKEVFSIFEAKVLSRLSPAEFEMAYQVRVAIDRIKFAVRATEQREKQAQELEEVCLQLLDALDRLESAERNFQGRFRRASGSIECQMRLHGNNQPALNGTGERS